MKTNIAELLKDCPKGMELDCASYDNVSFDKISDDKKAHYPIFCYITDKEGNRSGISFTENGCESKRYGAKCVIFPKGKTTWEGFHRPFEDGDIAASNEGLFIGIVKYVDKDCIYTYCAIDKVGSLTKNCPYHFHRLATEEEKQKLFQAIRNNGYKWNVETKTLEKLSEFNDGDILATNDGAFIAIIKKNGGKYYCCCHHTNGAYFQIDYSGWFDRLATEEEKQILFGAIKERGYRWNTETKTLEKLPKFGVGNKIEKCGYRFTIKEVREYHYLTKCGNLIPINNQDDFSLVPNKFDITTLKAFESRVLVRDTDTDAWKGAFYSHYKSKKFYTIGGSYYYQCIPYEGNEHLLDTTTDCDDFYKTWEK